MNIDQLFNTEIWMLLRIPLICLTKQNDEAAAAAKKKKKEKKNSSKLVCASNEQ